MPVATSPASHNLRVSRAAFERGALSLRSHSHRPALISSRCRLSDRDLTKWTTGLSEAAILTHAMGSLIKKRRKRMRKKKHKKMLKRTRWQRRAAGK